MSGDTTGCVKEGRGRSGESVVLEIGMLQGMGDLSLDWREAEDEEG